MDSVNDNYFDAVVMVMIVMMMMMMMMMMMTVRTIVGNIPLKKADRRMALLLTSTR